MILINLNRTIIRFALRTILKARQEILMSLGEVRTLIEQLATFLISTLRMLNQNITNSGREILKI